MCSSDSSVDNNKIFGVSKVTGTTFTPFQLFSDGQVEFPNSSGLTRLRILDNGNVGIGTSAPGQNLDVIGRLKFRSDGSSSAGFWLTDNTGNENVFSGLTNINSTDSWGIWSGNAWRLTVSNLGEVGIGIGSNAPSARLDVRTNTASAKTIYGENFFSGTWDGYGVYGQSTNNPGYGFGVYGSGSYRGVYGVSDGTTYTGGTIGVYGSALGTAGTRYGVFGYAQGGTTNYGVYCNGNGAYTGTWSQVSDSKFKENILPFNGALSKVLLLEPKSYNLKSKEFDFMGFNSSKQIGLIAQEVEKVFPELVEDAVHPGPTDPKTGRTTGEEIHFKSMNYIGLTPILVQAIKEQQSQIEELKKQIEEQNRRIQQLEKRK